ncbi:YgjP-like metallopeptidase domain-containing protein [Sphingomonas sp.]|uniref:M48 family metallopeptidase n=1 Tax=Sphingomonas sp. TaxID=28214 RepID=UPI00286EA42B|nr:YgjP-like metallopeptidase domain-containing protein [Sphingomonas sp.]
MSSTARSEALAYHEALPLPVDIRPVRTARRLRLRVDHARGVLRLTCPLRTSRRSALAWAAEQQAWVATQIAALPPGEPLAPGRTIPIEGAEVLLAWDEAAPRVPSLAGGVLSCGGPPDTFARRVERFLRRRAVDTLSRETAEFAALAGVSARGVGVGDADTRWGSCSAAGRIRYSWRLILAPPTARRFVVAHEVAHLVHLNHGPAFKALEAQLFDGDVAAARALLRRLGPRLKRVGRGD